MSDTSAVPTVTVDAVPDSAFVLDVRETDEWNAGHMPGALHIPLGELPDRVGDLPADREIVVTCRSGGRSARAVRFLEDSGLRATNLDGGMKAWAAADRVMRSGHGGPPSVI